MRSGSVDTAATALQVLVVDDSQAQRTRVRSALEQAGLTVVGEAEDGAQALTQAAAHHPDVVLMDLRMPRMDGVQATRMLRRQQPDTPVVLWTGDDDAQLDRAVCTSGAQVGIPKHIGTVELIATLREACAAKTKTGRLLVAARTAEPTYPLRGSLPPIGKPSSSWRRPTGTPCAGRSGARSPVRSPTADLSWLPPTMYY